MRTVTVAPPSVFSANPIPALQRLSELVGRAQSVPEVLEAALDGLCASLGAERASVLLFDAEGVMRFKAWRGLSDEYRAAVEGHSPWKPDAPDPQPILVRDIAETDLDETLKSTIRAEGIAALAFIPLLDAGKLLGKFMVYRGQPHAFTPEEIALAQIIANQISFFLGRFDVIQRLNRSEERVRVALAAGRMGAWEWNIASGRISWSETLEAIHGLQAGAFGGTFQDFVSDMHPEDRDRVIANIQRTLQSGSEYSVQYRINRPDGEMRWLEAHGRVLRDASAKPTGMTGVCQDITDRKHAESQLLESEARFRAMADSAPVMIWVSGPDKGGVYFNKTWLEFTGRTLEQESGEGWLESVHPEDTSHLAACAGAFKERRPFTTRFRMRRHDGAYRWILDTGAPRFDEHGEFQGFIGSCIDVTEIEDARATLAAHRDRLESIVADRTAELERSHQQLRLTERMAAVGTLAAGLGHDMANLLLPIRTHIEAAQADADIPPSLAENVRSIAQCVQYLQRLTNGLRMLAVDPAESRGEERTSAPAWWPDVSGLLRSVVPAGIDLRVEIPEDLPDIAIQPHRLAQAVFNLVNNAAEAMHARGWGTISVVFGPADSGACVSVSDNGPGMPEEVSRRASEPFFTTKVRTKSTGLGLSLVHGVAQSAGGRVLIDSTLGEGTTVSLWLPFAHTDGTSPIARVSLPNPIRRAFVEGLLRQMGYDVAPDADGPVAVAVLDGSAKSAARARSLRTQSPEIALLVIGAPEGEWGNLRPETIPDAAALSEIRDCIKQLTRKRVQS